MLEGRGWDALTGQTKPEIHGDGWLAAISIEAYTKLKWESCEGP